MLRKFLQVDPRIDTAKRPALADTATAHAFSIGDESYRRHASDRRRADRDAVPPRRRRQLAAVFGATFGIGAAPEDLRG